jgi:histidine triad (HIT) family protein
MADKTIFEKLIAGELPSYRIWEDDKHFAFLDLYPVTQGHTLVVPKKPTKYIFEMEDGEYSELLLAAKRVAKVLKKATGVTRIGVVVAGFGVKDHVHVHLVPINSEGELLGKPKQLAQEEMTSIQKKVLDTLNGL